MNQNCKLSRLFSGGYGIIDPDISFFEKVHYCAFMLLCSPISCRFKADDRAEAKNGLNNPEATHETALSMMHTLTITILVVLRLATKILLPSARHLEEGRGTTILELLRRENCISRLCPRPPGSHPTPNTQIV